MLFANKPKYEYVIVGLGNPGDKYSGTRHNTGFRALDMLSEATDTSAPKMKFHSEIRDAVIEGHKCLLCKPQNFMNNSGTAVSEVLNFYKIQPEKVIVISDDVSMDTGRLRIRASGSSGGHNGLKDIIELCGTDKIPRIKIGVGQKPHPDYDLADWVLGKPSVEDSERISLAEKDAADAVRAIITDGLQKASAKFNR